MLNLQAIETLLVSAIKQRNQLKADTLRSLKTRIQNEQIKKGQELSEQEILDLVSSEAKKRKEAYESFHTAGRTEASEKEQAELQILSKFLPAQVSPAEIETKIDELISTENWSKADFGKAMSQLKTHFGNTADGSELSKILKTKLI